MYSAVTVVKHYQSEALEETFTDLALIDTSPNMRINSDSIEDLSAAECLQNNICPAQENAIVSSISARMNPFHIADERRSQWPDINQDLGRITEVYNTVKAFGLPNSLGAKVPLQSSIKLENWQSLAQKHSTDDWLVPMLQWGFPLQYTGPAPTNNHVKNHTSATQYPAHVRKYIAKELSEGALAGPYDQHPFPEAQYVNPIMSRPKGNSLDRRIIVDLAYPEGAGVNAHVLKNCVFGQSLQHELPTTADAIAMAKALDLDLVVAVVDIERAYRNYRSDPIDWPLLVISFDNKFYIDLGLPFGARLSSLYVQRIANLICAALRSKGIMCAMYLDDLFLACHKDSDVQAQFSYAMATIRHLGLPINYKKLISPSTHAIWLGVMFNFQNSTISIPQHKVDELLQAVTHIQSCKFISYKETQSLVGRIAHVARVIPAARIFMSRILDQLRASDRSKVYINYAILADLKWFKTYFSAYNATSLIDVAPPVAVIEADSSLAAGGAWCDGNYYIYTYPRGVAASHNICQLETLNYLVAVRAFVNSKHKGRTIELIGDNAGAISALTSGRAADPVLAAVSRALWFHCASKDIKIKFTHKNGSLLHGADALSRAPLGGSERVNADVFIAQQGLKPVHIYPAFINYSKYL